jgi:hypothetical protein
VIVSSNRLNRELMSAWKAVEDGGGEVHELESDIGEVESLFGVGEVDGGIHD